LFIIQSSRYGPDVAGKGIIEAVVAVEVAAVTNAPTNNMTNLVEQSDCRVGWDVGEIGDQITAPAVGQVIEGDGDVGDQEVGTGGNGNSAGSTCGVVVRDAETSTSSSKADGAGGEGGQYSDRANCAGEDNTRERDRFKGSCSIHEQF